TTQSSRGSTGSVGGMNSSVGPNPISFFKFVSSNRGPSKPSIGNPLSSTLYALTRSIDGWYIPQQTPRPAVGGGLVVQISGVPLKPWAVPSLTARCTSKIDSIL